MRKMTWEIISWFLLGVWSVASAVFTYVPLIVSLLRLELWGLEWQWWAIIGQTIFIGSIAFLIARLRSRLRYFTGEEAKQQREKDNLEIEKNRLEIKKLRSESPDVTLI